MNTFTINEICDILKVTRATVYAMINRGEIKTVIVGKRKRITEEELKRYLERKE